MEAVRMTRFRLGAKHIIIFAIIAILLPSALLASAATRHWRGQRWEYLMFGLAIENEEVTFIPALGNETDNVGETAYIEDLLAGDTELPQYLAALGDRGWELVDSEEVSAVSESVFAQLLVFTFKRPET